MPRLYIDKEFLPGYAKLEKTVQRAVDKALDMFGQHTHAGLHLEKLRNPKDQRIRTIRITDFWRGVVLAPEQGDEYLLLTVLPHDKANAFATSKKFTVNQVLGVLEVRDQTALEGFEPALAQVAGATADRLFDRVNDSDLTRLGVDKELLPIVRLLTSEDHLLALSALLPEPQYNALVALASGMSAEEAWQELSAYLVDAEPPETIDQDDLAAAIERTPDRYVSVSGPEELADILAHPFAVWRVFLHPRQRRVAYRPSHRGPVLVSGGAGTGKTVTVLHRAVFLAKRLPPGDGKDILVTTFTRGLAESLAEQLRLLVDDEAVLARIDVLNVDRFANQVVSAAEGGHPDIVDQPTYTRLWQAASRATGGALSASFLQSEWEQVILAQALPDRDAYLGCDRPGRGRPVRTHSPTRQQAWSAIAGVLDELRRFGQRTHWQVAEQAAELLAKRSAPPYRHVLVDEGQDLHPTQWRLLRRAVARGADDMFIVSDPNQRIYANQVSLARLGIEVRGRSNRLTVSYRTTHEILSWSVRMLAGLPAQGLDDAEDTLAGYHSPMHGRRPVVQPFPDRYAEQEGIVTKVREWLDAGVEPHAVGIAVRTTAKVKEIRAALRDAGIPNTAPSGVRVNTMHKMKGLEYRCVLVAGVDAGTVPASAALTPRDEDPVAHGQDLHRERCLLFVACTRARDALHLTHAGPPSPFLT
ncbi:UvrD-helicase domain-containing protein [Actinophytocola glycyrrhizae]|uniref:DNA 3'-5' helicase n=1 Tax=Actinophytocola glycyrrhizae TaxID=2044873 RepID=A0ABV9RZ50_9PSEU